MREFINPPAIVERDKRRAQELKKQIIQLDAKQNMAEFEMAELIYELDDGGHLQELGYPGLDPFVKENLNISVRQARYYKKFMVYAKVLNITRAKLEAAGSSKLKEITTLELGSKYLDTITNEMKAIEPEIVALIERAPTITLEVVKKVVLELKGKSEGDFMWYNTRVLREVHERVIAPAEELARKNFGNTIDIETGEEKPLSSGGCVEIWAQNYLLDDNSQPNEVGEEGGHQDEVETVEESVGE